MTSSRWLVQWTKNRSIMLVLGMLAFWTVVGAQDGTAQIVRYKSHGFPVFVVASPTAVTISELCAQVGQLASAAARARDGGISLQASLQLAQPEKTLTVATTLLVGTLYQTPTVTPEVARHLVEAGCLYTPSAYAVPTDVTAQAVPR